MVPAVAIAEERDPFSVRRRLRAGVGVASDAPEFLFHVLVEHFRLAAAGVDERYRPALEVGRRAIHEEVTRIEPTASAEAAERAERDRRAGLRLAARGVARARPDPDGVGFARHILVDRVDDFRS